MIEARTPSVPGLSIRRYKPVKGASAEVYQFLPELICWGFAEYAKHCHIYVKRYRKAAYQGYEPVSSQDTGFCFILERRVLL